jgi:hypothetical protein
LPEYPWILSGIFGETEVWVTGPREALAVRAVELAEQHFTKHGVTEVRRLAEQLLPFTVALDRKLFMSLISEEFMENLEQAEHATLSASGCDRWWNCSGSLRLTELLGTTSISTPYAAEGSAAHQLAHICLVNSQHAVEYIDREILGFTVNMEMAEAVQIYLDLCWELKRSGAECFTEKKFSLKSLNPPAPMFGTSDFSAIFKDAHELVIVDLKYGKGVAVGIKDNPQLKYYALGVMLAFPDVSFNTVTTIIVQPRVSGPPIKKATYDAIDILGWSVDLIDRAKATLEPDAPLHPGTWCRFCPASGQCPAQATSALSVAQIEFSEVVDPIRIAEKTPIKAPPDVTRLTPAQMAIMLDQADALDSFIKSLRAAAQSLIEHGTDIPGWKVVPKRPVRRWKDDETIAFALEMTGVPESLIWSRKIISPAQAEIALTEAYRKGDVKAAAAKQKAADDLRDLIVSVSSGGTLASINDARPTLPGRGAEFDLEIQPALASE